MARFFSTLTLAVTFAFSLMLPSAAAYACEECQSDKQPLNNAVLLNIGGIPLGAFEIQYQHRLGRKVTLIVPLELDYRHIITTETFLDPNVKDNFITTVGLGAKFHVWGESLNYGLYVSPLVQAGYLAPLGALSTGTGVVRSSVSFGADWIADFGFMLDLSVGLAHSYIFDVRQVATLAANPSTFYPAIRLLVGYAW